jgi:hypothetical protein
MVPKRALVLWKRGRGQGKEREKEKGTGKDGRKTGNI